MNKTVGLVGIGLLGAAIAKRLLDASLSVIGFDPNSKAVSNFCQMNANSAHSVEAVFEMCDTVVFCLPNSDISQQVIDECQDSISTNHIIVDTTTGRPNDAAAIGNRLSSRGATYIEANVAASSQQMLDGNAVLFLGGSEATIERIDFLLKILAAKTYHLGEWGSASKMKLVHNLVLGLNRAVLAEALNFSENVGIEPATALKILIDSPAFSGVMLTKGDKMVNQEFAPQAKLSQHRKDVELILETASDEAIVALSKLHLQMLLQCEQQGLGDLDNSAIIMNRLSSREN